MMLRLCHQPLLLVRSSLQSMHRLPCLCSTSPEETGSKGEGLAVLWMHMPNLIFKASPKLGKASLLMKGGLFLDHPFVVGDGK